MKWVEKNKKNTTTVWIVLLLIIAILSIWLCSIIELISNQITISTQGMVVEDSWLYEGALRLWKSAYVVIILSATAILIASGLVTLLLPQSQNVIKKVKSKNVSDLFQQNLSRDAELVKEPHCV